MSINNVIISGNLTRNAELRTSKSGVHVSEFCIAVNERVRNANGEYEDYPNFIDCVLFGKRAESLSQYLTKGLKVAVSGNLSQQRWTDDKGNNRSRIRVIVNELDLMSRIQQAQQVQQQPATQNNQQQFVANSPEPAIEFANEDIPF